MKQKIFKYVCMVYLYIFTGYPCINVYLHLLSLDHMHQPYLCCHPTLYLVFLSLCAFLSMNPSLGRGGSVLQLRTCAPPDSMGEDPPSSSVTSEEPTDKANASFFSPLNIASGFTYIGMIGSGAKIKKTRTKKDMIVG